MRRRRTLGRIGALAAIAAAVCMLSVPAFAAKKTLKMWTLGGNSYQQIHKALLPEFQKEFPDIDLQIEYTNDVLNKFTIAVASGSAPDIITLSSRYAAQFVDQGVVAPVDYSAFGVSDEAGLAALFLPGAINSFKIRGKVYFMPTELSIIGMFYNQDMLDELGLGKAPTVWEEIGKLGPKIVKRDSGGTIIRHALGIDRSWIWPIYWWTALIRQTGISLFDASGKPQFAGGQAIKAITAYKDTFEFYKAADPTLADPRKAFANGDMGFILGASYEVFNFAKTKVPFEIGAAPFPTLAEGKPSTVSYAYGDFVFSGSKYQKEAWQVIDFFTSQRYAEKWFRDVSLFIPRKGAWIDRVVKDLPLYKPFLASFSFAQPQLAHAKFNDIQRAIVSAEQKIVGGAVSVQQGLTTLQSEVSVIVGVK